MGKLFNSKLKSYNKVSSSIELGNESIMYLLLHPNDKYLIDSGRFISCVKSNPKVKFIIDDGNWIFWLK